MDTQAHLTYVCSLLSLTVLQSHGDQRHLKKCLARTIKKLLR